LTLKTALAKFYIIESGCSELFLIPVKSMAMLTFNIHSTKRMTPSRFLIGSSAWRQILLSQSLMILHPAVQPEQLLVLPQLVQLQQPQPEPEQ
jgi:hypothetical protein